MHYTGPDEKLGLPFYPPEHRQWIFQWAASSQYEQEMPEMPEY